jgi:putative endonuclease
LINQELENKKMWFTYIIYSKSHDRYYVGYSQNPATELERHNLGGMPATRRHKPWQLVYTEKYPGEQDALRRSREIKSKRSKSYIEQLLKMDY